MFIWSFAKPEVVLADHADHVFLVKPWGLEVAVAPRRWQDDGPETCWAHAEDGLQWKAKMEWDGQGVDEVWEM